jgi:hypothetical protein
MQPGPSSKPLASLTSRRLAPIRRAQHRRRSSSSYTSSGATSLMRSLDTGASSLDPAVANDATPAFGRRARSFDGAGAAPGTPPLPPLPPAAPAAAAGAGAPRLPPLQLAELLGSGNASGGSRSSGSPRLNTEAMMQVGAARARACRPAMKMKYRTRAAALRRRSVSSPR